MATKMRDEVHHYYELRKRRDIKKKRLGEEHHPKTKTYKKIIQYLREEAAEVKRELSEKNKKKVEHLEKKFRETEDDEMVKNLTEELDNLDVGEDTKTTAIEVVTNSSGPISYSSILKSAKKIPHFGKQI